jgi:DNA-binding transcriptional LysR family regulator
MLELRRLRLLYELDRRGTIAAVAAALHFSPSGVSQQLTQLEGEVGLPLLERVGRNVRLTEAAKVLVAHTKMLLSQMELAESELAAFSGRPSGTVRVASFQTAAVAILPTALTTLHEYEELRVQLCQAEPEVALPGLFAHDFDMVICEDYPGFRGPVSTDVVRETLCVDSLNLVRGVSPARPMDARAAVAAARDDVWVMEPVGSLSRSWAVALCRSLGFEPDVRFEASDISIHTELVRHGHASAFLPDLAWCGQPRPAGTLALPGQVRYLSTVVRPGSERNPAIRAVRSALVIAAGRCGSLPRPHAHDGVRMAWLPAEETTEPLPPRETVERVPGARHPA